MSAATPDLPGFADPVHDAQACFRAVLDALSRPGTVATVPAGFPAPAPLGGAAASVALTLLDADTTLALDPAFERARHWLAFHCGVPFAAAADAAFVLTPVLPDLRALPAGTDEEPQNGATVVVQLPALRGGPSLRVSGPGVDGAATIGPAGLPSGFAAHWAANHALFPRGVDLILCAGTELLALPRSVRVEEI